MSAFDDATEWAGHHPVATGAIVIVGGLAILYLLGYIGGNGSTDQSGNNLAAAYYAAEAAQTTAGTQLQMATVYYGNQTAQVALQTQAQQAIAATDANAATTINGQNASATTALGYDQLLTTQSNNDTALAETQSNNATSLANTSAAVLGSEVNQYLGSVLPEELAQTKGYALYTLPGQAATSIGPGGQYPNIDTLMSEGYTLEQADAIAGSWLPAA